MPSQLTFRAHEEFHRAAVHMAIGGGLAGLAAHVAGLASPEFGSLAGPWGLAAVAGAAGYAAQPPAERTEIRALVTTIGLALAAGAGQLFMGGQNPAFSHGLLFALPVAILLSRGLTGRRFALGLAAGWLAALAARFVLIRLATAPELATLPPWLVAAAAGAASAFTMVVGLLPRHLDVVLDRVADARARIRPKLTGEVAELADRAADVWTRVEANLEPATRAPFEDAVVRLYEVAGRWAGVEADGARTPVEALVERMDQIDAKIAAASDDIARTQYEHARAALAEQLKYLKEIGTMRERVVARMHHYLAAMERLRFAVINHRSHETSQKSSEVQPILEDLRDLGRDIDFGADALGELEKDEPARPTAQA